VTTSDIALFWLEMVSKVDYKGGRCSDKRLEAEVPLLLGAYPKRQRILIILAETAESRSPSSLCAILIQTSFLEARKRTLKGPLLSISGACERHIQSADSKRREAQCL